ncbi:hypothetical protein LK09_14215 [Microbacterium mangrovi]|uniref:DUF2188 domain-containing protein n=1 Tax=Microbacterium mangrovi TaxID=1348253 RepID=A0A0B2A4I4_9MICO|nr:hypothetical protein [Microbacterium mangrovi]KHK96517.1 hypothetical protein LK09_14215 [Microbacterium mangrovi]
MSPTPDDSEALQDGDVETLSERGYWVTRVVGDPSHELSFSDYDEAVTMGRALAEAAGSRHIVPADRFHNPVPPPGIATGRMPATTDGRGLPFDNPSG